MKEIKKSRATKTNKTKHLKKHVNPDDAHWVKSRAKLMKILEAAGMAPVPHKIMITCDKDR